MTRPFSVPDAQASLERKLTEKLRGFCAAGLVVSREKIQYLVVELRNGFSPRFRLMRGGILPGIFFPLYNPFGHAHNLCFRYPKGNGGPFSHAEREVACDRR